MRSRTAALLLALALLANAQTWQIALPGYQYEFPRDYFNHPDYRTEWWYYTGNLKTADGHRYGFELTFFRQGIDLTPQAAQSQDPIWRPDQIYLAHLALSDLGAGHFFHTSRLNRAGPGLAGVSLGQRREWNGNWQVLWTDLSSGRQQLQAICDQFKLTLALTPAKPPVVNGKDGVSRKGPEPAQTSHYFSFTRIEAHGDIYKDGKRAALSGLAWMDHEFFTGPSRTDLAGWDWFAIQLENDEELMLYRLRLKSGGISPYSSGTFVDSSGTAHFLDASEFSLSPSEKWRSSASGASYPANWTISVPSLDLRLSEWTDLKNQELFDENGLTPTYWEGAVSYAGAMQGKPLTGVGYLEMTGYAKDFASGDSSQVNLGRGRQLQTQSGANRARE